MKRCLTKPVDFRSVDSLILRRPRSFAVPFASLPLRKGPRMTSDVWESGYAAYGLPKERWSRSMLFSVFFRGDKFCPVISLGFFFFWSPRDFWGVLIFAPHSIIPVTWNPEYPLWAWVKLKRMLNFSHFPSRVNLYFSDWKLCGGEQWKSQTFFYFVFFRSRSRVPVMFRSMLDSISWRVDTK